MVSLHFRPLGASHVLTHSRLLVSGLQKKKQEGCGNGMETMPLSISDDGQREIILT